MNKPNYFATNRVVPTELLLCAVRKLQPDVHRIVEVQLWSDDWLEFHVTATNDIGIESYFMCSYNKGQNGFQAFVNQRNFRHQLVG